MPDLTIPDTFPTIRVIATDDETWWLGMQQWGDFFTAPRPLYGDECVARRIGLWVHVHLAEPRRAEFMRRNFELDARRVEFVDLDDALAEVRRYLNVDSPEIDQGELTDDVLLDLWRSLNRHPRQRAVCRPLPR